MLAGSSVGHRRCATEEALVSGSSQEVSSRLNCGEVKLVRLPETTSSATVWMDDGGVKA